MGVVVQGAEELSLYTGNPRCLPECRSIVPRSLVLLSSSLAVNPHSPKHSPSLSLRYTPCFDLLPLYFSVWLVFHGYRPARERLPAATRLASRDARITALVFLLRFPRRMAGIGKTKKEKVRIRDRRMYRVNGYV